MKDGYDFAEEMFAKIGESDNHEVSIEDALKIISFWGFNEESDRSSKIGFVCYCAREKIKKIFEQALVYGDFSSFLEFEQQMRRIAMTDIDKLIDGADAVGYRRGYKEAEAKNNEDRLIRQTLENFMRGLYEEIQIGPEEYTTQEVYDLLDKEIFTNNCVPSPVKIGHWVETGRMFEANDNQLVYEVLCDKCKGLSYFRKSENELIGAKHCPCCGLQMDGHLV